MFRKNHVAYTRKDLQDLWHKLKALPIEINRKRDVLGEHTAELTTLELKLAEFVKSDLTPNAEKIASLQARIDVLTLPAKILQFEIDIASHAKKVTELKQQQISLIETILPIDQQLAMLAAVVKKTEMTELFVKIKAALDAVVSELDARQQTLQTLHAQMEAALDKEQSLKAQLESARAELAKSSAGEGFASDAQKTTDGYGSTAQAQAVSGSTQQIEALANQLHAAHAQVAVLGDDIERLELERNQVGANRRKLDADIHRIGNDIDNCARRLINFKYTENLPALRELIRQESVKKAPLEKQLLQVNQALEFNSSRVSSLTSEHRMMSLQLEQARPLSEPHRDNYNLVNLKAVLASSEKLADQHETKRLAALKEFEKQREKIIADEDEIKRKEEQYKILQKNNFLTGLRDKPLVMLDALRERLKLALKQYRNDHPESEDVCVRSCLLTLKNKMSFILNQPAGGVDLNKIYREQFYQASGLLWHAYRQTVAKSPDFVLMIEEVLGVDVIQDEDAISVYSHLKEKNKAALRDFSKEEIKLYDESEFARASREFNDLLKKIPAKASRVERNYYHKGEELLAAIVAQKQLTEKKGRFDVKLHTEILKVSAQLLLQPDHADLCDRLSELSRHKLDGHYSVAKNVIGAIGAFIGGVLLIVGGVALGGSLPVISWPVAGTMIAGGVTLFGGGLALCVSGRKKGTQKALDNYDYARAATVKCNINKFLDTSFQSTSPEMDKRDEQRATSGALDLKNF